jgi:2-dehydro-3-deoxyphosphogluconate aldolase / (4S)-4-hydroxy-2-oxoglutarate aldolase
MTDRTERLRLPTLLESTRLVAIMRHIPPAEAVRTAEALVAGGVRALEVTLNSAGALEMIRAIVDALGDKVLIGAGTVLSTEAADAAFEAGVQFVVTPHTDDALIRHVVSHGVPIIPGALTPSEVLRAWNAGASAVKIFPAGPVGPGYVKDLRGPLPEIPFVPTGGITLENAEAFITAGAWGLGLGSALVDMQLIAGGDWSALSVRAAALARVAQAAVRQPSASASDG